MTKDQKSLTKNAAGRLTLKIFDGTWATRRTVDTLTQTQAQADAHDAAAEARRTRKLAKRLVNETNAIAGIARARAAVRGAPNTVAR